MERDERRLSDLGRRAVEMFAAVHIASTLMEVRRGPPVGRSEGSVLCWAVLGWAGQGQPRAACLPRERRARRLGGLRRGLQ